MTAYVIDTGVNVVGDLVGRVAERHDFTATGLNDCLPSGGHGTKVASALGGATYGVAKSVRLVSLKAYGCTAGTGTNSVIAALNWIVANRPAAELSVANISLSYGIDVNLDRAVRDAVAADVVVVVGAGNNGNDACNFSPSRAGNPTVIPDNPGGYSAITVAATDRVDSVGYWGASSSNTGPCVDIFAPGTDITAQGTTGVITNWSGTSAASPHVAGVAALTLSKFGDITPGMAENYIFQNATLDVVGASLTPILEGTPNRLIYQVQPPKRRSCCTNP